MNHGIKYTLVIILLTSVCFFISCGTSVNVSVWEPALINLSSYRGIGIQSTKAASSVPVNFYIEKRFSGLYPMPVQIANMRSYYTGNENVNVARKVTGLIESGLNQGVYKVVNSTTLDTLIQQAQLFPLLSLKDVLLKQNIDVLITSVINNMSYEEFITCEVNFIKQNQPVYSYYLNQRATLNLTYYVQDVKSVSIIHGETIDQVYPSSGYKQTLLGRYDSSTGIYYPSAENEIPKAENMFVMALNGLSDKIKNTLTPHKANVNLQLMENKSKIKSLDTAYEYVNSGFYNQALSVFLNEWNMSSYIPAGYNAVVMYVSMGDFNRAIDMALYVYNKTGNPDVYALYTQIKLMQENEQKAYSQINNTGNTTNRPSGELIIF